MGDESGRKPTAELEGQFGSFPKLGNPSIDAQRLYSLLWGPPKRHPSCWENPHVDGTLDAGRCDFVGRLWTHSLLSFVVYVRSRPTSMGRAGGNTLHPPRIPSSSRNQHPQTLNPKPNWQYPATLNLQKTPAEN